MKIGFKQWSVKTPKMIKIVAGIALTISTVITTSTVWTENMKVQKFGAICMAISGILPKFVGETKDEQTNEEPIA